MSQEEGSFLLSQPPHYSLHAMLNMIALPNGEACLRLFFDHRERFEYASGSKHKHQAWPDGYFDHIEEAMNLGLVFYEALAATGRALPFTRSDVLLVLFLHDLEKPWKYGPPNEEGSLTPLLRTKLEAHAFRFQKIAEYGIRLSPDQLTALLYVEGEGADYTPHARLLNELGTVCFCADTTSARLFHGYPLAEDDPWTGAKRVRK